MVVFGLFIAANSFTISIGCIDSRTLSMPRIKRLVLCWLACAAALFLNPYGWRLVFYPFNLAFEQKLNIANIEEWKSLDFHTPRGRIMLFFLGLLFLFQLIRSRKWGLFGSCPLWSRWDSTPRSLIHDFSISRRNSRWTPVGEVAGIDHSRCSAPAAKPTGFGGTGVLDPVLCLRTPAHAGTVGDRRRCPFPNAGPALPR